MERTYCWRESFMIIVKKTNPEGEVCVSKLNRAGKCPLNRGRYKEMTIAGGSNKQRGGEKAARL